MQTTIDDLTPGDVIDASTIDTDRRLNYREQITPGITPAREVVIEIEYPPAEEGDPIILYTDHANYRLTSTDTVALITSNPHPFSDWGQLYNSVRTPLLGDPDSEYDIPGIIEDAYRYVPALNAYAPIATPAEFWGIVQANAHPAPVKHVTSRREAVAA